MYVAFYGFDDHPFLMTPDARLFYASSVHSRAQAHLIYGLEQREGFVIITGEVGAGKTTLIERLCAQLDPTSFAVARIMTTQVSGDDLLRLVADGFGVPSDGNKAQLLRGITDMLRGGEQVGRRHVLIVDEAQALPMPALEELRMLSNITEGGRALLQVVLLGQPQLRRTMASPDLDQLRQRVLASFHLGGLSREETHAYVEHRLRAVGWTGNPAWHADALDIVHRFSGGIPRRINRLCSRVLLGAALEQSREITAEMVETTARELEGDLSGGLAPGTVQGAGGTLGGVDHALMTGRVNGASAVETQRMAELANRIEALEQMSARRERVFNRLMDLFAGGGRLP
ncbi:AAA family ATPase [Elioraea sp.]|uniref:AAA family ATPase n=1 Tax=Elioraea sp. TaxID=2185103 RepID=UPI0025C1CCCA|nr:AAA family ATPase [Elioraea sp.]